MTDTTTEAVEGLARRIERHAEPMDSIKIKDVLDMSAHCGVAMLRALAAERDALRAALATKGMNCRSYKAMAEDAIHRMDNSKDQLATAEAQAKTARDALEDITGVGFDIPATLELSDAEWSRRRASIMQQIARSALIQPTPTTPRTDAEMKD